MAKTITIKPGIGSSIAGTHATALATIKWDQSTIDAKVGLLLRKRIEQCVKLAAEVAAENMEDIAIPSDPYEFPHRQTGALADSITYDVNGMLFDVRGRFGILYTHADDGTYLIYAFYLETGTVNMLPRPWLALTLDEVRDDWQKILGGSAAPDLSNTPMQFSVEG